MTEVDWDADERDSSLCKRPYVGNLNLKGTRIGEEYAVNECVTGKAAGSTSGTRRSECRDFEGKGACEL